MLTALTLACALLPIYGWVLGSEIVHVTGIVIGETGSADRVTTP